jgi:HTH-type transcriptional regulator, sugar sensing transcriptional regulator
MSMGINKIIIFMLERDLQDIGLNEKEAKVYLASLEIGQSVVQDIAKKASVNRATTYFVIEGLIKMGLMSSFHKGKKQYFVAADPDRLVDILNQEKNNIDKKKESLDKILPQLTTFSKRHEGPVVKYYEGKDGIRTMIEELVKKSKGDVYMAYSVDAVNKIFSEKERSDARAKRIKKGLKTKAIYTYKDGFLKSSADGERRKISINNFPLTCDIAIYDDYVRIASLGKRLVGIVIEDKDITNSLRSVFKLAWDAAEKYQK